MQQLLGLMNSMLQNRSMPDKVAKVVLEAVTSQNPNLRYTAGDDATFLVQKRKERTYSEFKKFVSEFLSKPSA